MDIYLARQSIYDINENVIAYEILFRDTLDNRYILDEKIDPTKILLSNMNAIGIKRISNNKKIFVNFDKANIYNDLAYTLEKKFFIIEILESVEITDKLIEKLRCLKLAGYIIAFDDYTIKKNIDKILEYIDIIKVDFLESTDVEIKEIADKYKSEKILLAEKIERKEVFDFAKKLGYNFFQGYFFGKPEILKSLL